MNIKILKLGGALLAVRVRFKNHMVLVQLRIHGADLPLSISVVERAVNRRGRNSKPRCGYSIDNQRYCQSTGLLVGSHIGQLRQLLHLLHQLGRPQVQLVRVRIL